jgi:hypothetical protein
MRTRRRQRATTGLVVLAALLGALWVGGLAARSTDDPAGRLTASSPLLGLEAGTPPHRAPALRPAAARPDPGGRLIPLLLGLLVAAVAAGSGLRARRCRSTRVQARSLVWSTQLRARAPPSLQPA